MKKYILIIFLMIPLLSMAQNQVGEEIRTNYETDHPYIGNSADNYKLVWNQEIYQEGASYIAIHFDHTKLSPQDYLVVRDPKNTRTWSYSFREIEDKRNSFWSIPIYGEKAVIEIFSRNSSGSYGYHIDKIAKGFPLGSKLNEDEALCGNDDSVNAICYSATETEAYAKSRAVARLLINGTGACTGWLIGDDGHLMTNEHCIQNQADASNVTIEFMAEGSNCSSNCNSWFACPGVIAATSANLVKANAPLDYALLSLGNNVSGTYGFLQLRESGAVVNERIYIPQHPRAWGKRIALSSSHPNDSGGFARVSSLTEPRCGATSGNDVGYFADTQGGSSGSPVLGYNDNLVVALHHCANCPNRGVPIEEIITDLGNDLPNNAISSCQNNIFVTTDVPTGSISQQQATTSITANNTIPNGGEAIYHAGTAVTLLPGFHAQNGSEFRGYIEGCSDNFASRVGTDQVNADTYEYEKNDLEGQAKSDFSTADITKSNFIIYPNPTTGGIQIKHSYENTSFTLAIHDYAGKRILAKNVETTNSELDLSHLASGVYIVTLINGSDVFTERLIISN